MSKVESAMRRGLAVTSLALLLVGLPGRPASGAPGAEPAREAAAPQGAGDETFRRGYELFEKKDYVGASANLRAYLEAHRPGDENYDWAQFFLGICLFEQGLSHAAGDLLSHLVSAKPNAKIVSYSLDILEEIGRTRPFDREGILLQTLCDQEYGFVDQRHQDFIQYYQGLYDWEHGYRPWGDDHFRKIAKGTPYYYKYLYQDALYRIDADDLDGAAAILIDVVTSDVPDRVLKNEARITLARVWYEQGKYDLSDAAYRDVDMPNVEQARYLLERAWGQYRKGNPEKAMGLLYAFEAPSFWRHFTPEYFLLKSFLYKDVCQYSKALKVVQEFHGRYDGALRFLYERGEPQDNAELLLVLLERPSVRRLDGFLSLLEEERAAAAAWPAEGLRGYLTGLYDLQIEETSKELRGQLLKEYEALAEDLLRFEEQAHLMEYEVGLDMSSRTSEFRYRKGGAVAGEKQAQPQSVAFAFQGEFWNDELDDYRVVLENKCDSPEEWDVFFQ